MKPTLLIVNANIVNAGQQQVADVLIRDGRIEKIASNITNVQPDRIIDATGLYLFPGIIDDQVHFREPGLTHKADIHSESRAAVAGGITSFMEMPNTVPQATTQKLLQDKYDIAAASSLANYSFFMGATNENIEEVLKTDKKSVCGVKVFMGSSTGDMLVDNEQTLRNIFSQSKMLIATHCEDEATIRRNTEFYLKKYGEDVPFSCHPLIRSEEACYKSSSLAVSLAKEYDTRLHVLHISTAKELALFDDPRPLGEKRITAEACVHHLWFSEEDYAEKGSFIKWNPAIKKASDREAILNAVINGPIDIVATDHAPHTLAEKENSYFKAPSGGPLVQHALVAMLEYYHKKRFTLERIVEMMCHNPARCFDVKERGYIQEGFHADLVLVNLNSPWEVKKENILSKCGWSPFEGMTFLSQVVTTIVSGEIAYEGGICQDDVRGERLEFDRV